MLVHPRALEEPPVVVARAQSVPVFVENLKLDDIAVEGLQIAGQFGDARPERGSISRRLFGVFLEARALPALELSAPEAAEVEIARAVRIQKLHGSML